jgi:hypothetical protein
MISKWLESYSGQNTEQLLSLEGEYRADSLVAAFEQAIDQKSAAHGFHSLTLEEQFVLAVEALEREVNNGGYSQFFTNSSAEHCLNIVIGLERIGCPKTADITKQALNALNVPRLNAETIHASMATESDARDDALSECDDLYYDSGEDIAGQLFAFIKINKSAIKL